MLTGDIRNQVDTIWNSFWTGGISNPLEVIEQITYLLFLRRLDDLHTVEELKATRLKKPMERRVFPEGVNPISNAISSKISPSERWSLLSGVAVMPRTFAELKCSITLKKVLLADLWHSSMMTVLKCLGGHLSSRVVCND